MEPFVLYLIRGIFRECLGLERQALRSGYIKSCNLLEWSRSLGLGYDYIKTKAFLFIGLHLRILLNFNCAVSGNVFTF
jgi:hypothetical protein